MNNKRETKARSVHPRDLLVHSIVAVLALGFAEPGEVIAAGIDADAIEYDDERRLRQMSDALRLTLSKMNDFDRSSAVCELAASNEAELRMVAALCLGEEAEFVGGRWCREALATDPSRIVRRAYDFAVGELPCSGGETD